MKEIILTFVILFHLSNCFSQTNEFGLSFNSGLFSFVGKSANGSTSLNSNTLNNTGYTNNPYGSRYGLCYGISGYFKKLTKKNQLLGIDLGMEVLRSKTKINNVSEYNGSSNISINSDGRTFLKNIFINVFPNIGFRLNAANCSIDFSGGFDLAFGLKTTEDVNASTSSVEYNFSREREKPNIDVRPRGQISLLFGKMGGYLGYSIGVINYKSGYVGGTNEAFANLFRFGLFYNI